MDAFRNSIIKVRVASLLAVLFWLFRSPLSLPNLLSRRAGRPLACSLLSDRTSTCYKKVKALNQMKSFKMWSIIKQNLCETRLKTMNLLLVNFAL